MVAAGHGAFSSCRFAAGVLWDFKQSISSFQRHPFDVVSGTIWRRDFTEGSKTPLSLCTLLQLSRGLLQTLCRILEIKGEKVVSPLTFNPCFQFLNSAACLTFFPGTSSEVHYKISLSKQKPQPCPWTEGTEVPGVQIHPPLGGELVLAFFGWTRGFYSVILLAEASL